MPIVAIPILPKWAPKDCASLLKEEYLAFHQEVTQYHDQIEGYLIDNLELMDKFPEVPVALNAFTDKMAIILTAMELQPYLSNLRSTFDKVCQRCAEHAEHAQHTVTMQSALPATTSHHRSLKVSLPNQFDGSAATILTFQQECNTYISLNHHHFLTDAIKIQWTL